MHICVCTCLGCVRDNVRVCVCGRGGPRGAEVERTRAGLPNSSCLLIPCKNRILIGSLICSGEKTTYLLM